MMNAGRGQWERLAGRSRIPVEKRLVPPQYPGPPS